MDESIWRENIQIGEEYSEAAGKLCKKFNSGAGGARDRERRREGKRRT